MREPASLDGIHEIPDLIPPGAAASVPAPVLPAEAAPTRADRRKRAILAASLAAIWVAAAVALLGLRSDLGTPGVAAPIAAWLACGAVTLGALLRPRERGLPAGVRLVQHAVWIVPAAFVAGALIVSRPDEVPLTWHTVRTCLVMSSVMAVGPFTAAAVLLRGSFLSAPGWRGAAVGALTGLAGSVGIHAHCPCQTISHLLTAHGAAILFGAAAGAGLGVLGGRS